MALLLEHCTALFHANRGLFTVFFLAGLTGGFTHCLVMCGSFAACGRLCAGEACGKQAGMARRLGFSYHFGRFLAYGALGFLAALFSRQIAAFSFWPWLSAGMLWLAGLMFVVSALPQGVRQIAWFAGRWGFLRGALMGFMPCGMLYAALMMAATLADPWAGMAAMWIFVLGTLPALLIAGVGADFVTLQWQGAARKIGRVAMAFNGLTLLVMAEKLVR